jgi:ParB family chromosome partitioning protein
MELAEIDENLVRNELHYIDRASHLNRRKEIYEEMHPETRKGAVNQYTKELLSEINSDSKNSFVKDTAEKLNVSERKVEQEIQIAKNIAQNTI